MGGVVSSCRAANGRGIKIKINYVVALKWPPDDEITQQPTKNTRASLRMYRRGGLTGGERRGSVIRLFGDNQAGRGG